MKVLLRSSRQRKKMQLPGILPAQPDQNYAPYQPTC
jgi:hypothetical protein